MTSNVIIDLKYAQFYGEGHFLLIIKHLRKPMKRSDDVIELASCIIKVALSHAESEINSLSLKWEE